MNNRKIRVLVVDDSVVFRQLLVRGISSDPGIEVVAWASDPFDARDKILKYEPDVMTCDVEMPRMNGIEFIQKLMPQYPMPVVVVSSLSSAVFDAMNAGAVDFVNKPEKGSAKNVDSFINELIIKIKTAALSNIRAKKLNQDLENARGGGLSSVNSGYRPGNVNDTRLIAIGASTGGTEAIYSILRCLPPSVPGIVIVQHIPPGFSRMFAERLNNSTQLKVREAQSGEYIENGCVFVAPGDAHLRVKKVGARFKTEVFHGEKVSGHCPSADVLFESVAKECGKNAVGIILTGMGYDGAKGLLAMRRSGARTIGQDEKSCVVYGMPKVAFNIGAVEKQVSLTDIPGTLFSMLAQD